MPIKKTGVTAILPGGTRVHFPRCNRFKTEFDVHNRITRYRLFRDVAEEKLLGEVPGSAILKAHWNE